MDSYISRNFYALALTVSAGLLAGFYILWGPSSDCKSSKKKLPRKDRCPGLLNQGNSCFLNAVLQACATSQSLKRWLEEQYDKPTQCTRLTGQLLKLMKALNNEDDEIDIDIDNANPYAVIEALREKRWIISPDQQDAHELFEVLTESLDEERARQTALLSLFDVQLIISSTIPCCINRYKTVWSSLVRDRPHSYQGLLATKLQCKRCSYTCPVRYTEFDCLSLPIPTMTMGRFDLKHLLLEFIQPEYVDGVECVRCTERYRLLHGNKHLPPQKSVFSKQTSIAKLPASLCIHIQRTVWLNNGLPSKRREHVSFPEYLSMAPYVHVKRESPSSGTVSQLRLLGGSASPMVGPSSTVGTCRPSLHTSQQYFPFIRHYQPNTKFFQNQTSIVSNFTNTTSTGTSYQGHDHRQPKTWYNLTALIEHMGDVQSGHFVTYRHAPRSSTDQRWTDDIGLNVLNINQTWLLTSDTFVQRCKWTDVHSASAYMLFYERDQ